MEKYGRLGSRRGAWCENYGPDDHDAIVTTIKCSNDKLNYSKPIDICSNDKLQQAGYWSLKKRVVLR